MFGNAHTHTPGLVRTGPAGIYIFARKVKRLKGFQKHDICGMVRPVMKTIIIAGGISRRLLPLTTHIPKTLLPLKEKKILEHILDNAQATGLRDVHILTGHGHTHVQQFAEEYTTQNPDVQITLHYIDNYLTTGNVVALRYIEPLLDEDAVIINSDTIFHSDVLQLLLDSEHPNAMMIDDQKTLGAEEMKVLVDDKHNVYRIHKSLTPATSHGEYVGILKLSPDIREQLKNSTEATMAENQMVYYEDALQHLINNHKIQIKAISTQGLPVMEIDTHEDLAAARDLADKI